MNKPYIRTPPTEDCDHPGLHTYARNCPFCGRFSPHSWQTFVNEDSLEYRVTADGPVLGELISAKLFWLVLEGGDCGNCGEWLARISWHVDNPPMLQEDRRIAWLKKDQGYQVGQ